MNRPPIAVLRGTRDLTVGPDWIALACDADANLAPDSHPLAGVGRLARHYTTVNRPEETR